MKLQLLQEEKRLGKSRKEERKIKASFYGTESTGVWSSVALGVEVKGWREFRVRCGLPQRGLGGGGTGVSASGPERIVGQLEP